jgi:hypothetical protein
VHDLHDLLARCQALHDVGAEGTLLHGGDELPHDAEVDVGLEQREADLAHRAVDVVLAQAPLAAQAVERRAEPVGEGVEHRRSVDPPVESTARSRSRRAP